MLNNSYILTLFIESLLFRYRGARRTQITVKETEGRRDKNVVTERSSRGWEAGRILTDGGKRGNGIFPASGRKQDSGSDKVTGWNDLLDTKSQHSSSRAI
jgi:hypothetical protein